VKNAEKRPEEETSHSQLLSSEKKNVWDVLDQELEDERIARINKKMIWGNYY
jgi:hypothetical protein